VLPRKALRHKALLKVLRLRKLAAVGKAEGLAAVAAMDAVVVHLSRPARRAR
jgi:hypothetical protein